MNCGSVSKSILESIEESSFFIAQCNLKQPGPEPMSNALKDVMQSGLDAKLNRQE